MASRTGRPRAVSAHTLEEAASELFLERGYVHTSIDDIAARAGISRATFFNYFAQKSDLLFVSVDAALDQLEQRLDEGMGLREAIAHVADSVACTEVPLVVTQAEAMGALEDAVDAGPARVARLRLLVATEVDQPVWQWAVAGAIAEAAKAWALGPHSGGGLRDAIAGALAALTKPPHSLPTIELL